MSHLVRHPPLAAFAAQLNDALVRQQARMDLLFARELEERKARRLGAILGKHPSEAESSAQAAKRARLSVTAGRAGKGVEVDVSLMPLDSVIDAVLAGLEIMTEDLMLRAFDVGALLDSVTIC